MTTMSNHITAPVAGRRAARGKVPRRRIRPTDRTTLPAMSEPHLSPQAHARLKAELEERTTTRRRELSLWIERAREHGDISENADYDAAKNEQGHNEARVRQLEAML